MYYKDCTARYAVDFIKEIVANAENPYRLQSWLKMFLNNELTDDEIRKWMY